MCILFNNPCKNFNSGAVVKLPLCLKPKFMNEDHRVQFNYLRNADLCFLFPWRNALFNS